jgi:ribonuclease HIII
MTNFSLSLNNQEIKLLKNLIEKKGLKTRDLTNQYELLRIKDDNLNIVVYKSGKLVHNGSYASKKILDTILIKEESYDYILGSDETGKGEWYGPLIVAATALSPEEILELRKLGVRDSKTIKRPKLLKMAETIIKMNFHRHSITLTPKTYNKLYSDFKKEGKTLNDLMAWAHFRVIKELLDKIEFGNAKIIIDQFDYDKTEDRMKGLDQTKLKVIQKTGGESETPVAAASIIAKYIFESEVNKLNQKYQVDLRKSKPEDIKPDLLPQVAKIHFKNVGKLLN